MLPLKYASCLRNTRKSAHHTIGSRTYSSSATESSLEYMFRPDWSSEGPLQKNNAPTHVYATEASRRSQMQWLDIAQYKLKDYWLCDAEEALDFARSCPKADPVLQRQLLLDMVLFCKQKSGDLAMEACIKMLQKYPMFATDPVGLANLGIILSLNKEHARAIHIMEKVPRNHPVWKDQVAAWLTESYALTGEHAKAEPIIAEVCRVYDDLDEQHIQREIRVAKQGSDSLDLDSHGWTCLRIKNLQLWAGILMELNRNREAVTVMQKAVKEGKRIMGDDDAITAGAKNILGLAFIRDGQIEQSIEPLEEGTAFLESRLTGGDKSLCTSINLLRAYCEKLGRYKDAHRHSLRHRNMIVQLYGKNSPHYTNSTMNYARHLMQIDKHGKALQELSSVEKCPANGARIGTMIARCIEILQKRK